MEDTVGGLYGFVLFAGVLIVATGVPDLIRQLDHPELWNEGIYNPVMTGCVIAIGVAMILLVAIQFIPENRPLAELRGLANIVAGALFVGGLAIFMWMERSHPINVTINYGALAQKQSPSTKESLHPTSPRPERKTK